MEKKTVTRLGEAPPSSFKYVFIGKTGSGKSTLLNCLLGSKILPSSASGACTSTVFEISYQDSDTIQMTILFQSEAEWLPKLQHLLEDVQNTTETSHKSREILLLVYPNLGDSDLTRVTAKDLLNSIRDHLGVSVRTQAADHDDCRKKLRDYLVLPPDASTVMRAPWPLVQRVEISGRFPVLARGITLVDLPGDGDIDDTRNSYVEHYIKHGDGFVLVADVKRAQDDRGTHDHLKKILNQLVLDGRVVDDTVVLVATHNDDIIGDDELLLHGENQSKFQRLVKEMKELSVALKKTKGPKVKSNQELAHEFKDKQAERALFLANIRISNVREKLQALLVGLPVNSGLVPTGRPERLPVFCVASRDYLALDSFTDPPTVFTNEEQIEIPDLVAHICKTGECRRLRWAINQLDRGSAFCEGVHSYFAEGRHPGQLTPESKKNVLAIITALEKTNLGETSDLLEGIQDALQVVESELKKAVEKAATDAPKIIRNFGKFFWSTYRATMRMHGVFPPHDLNRDLKRTILPNIQGSWNVAMNHRIPLILKDAIQSFEQSTRSAIEDVVKALDGQGPTFQQAVATARQSLAVEGIFSDLLEHSIQTIAISQRDGTRSFKSVVQNQLKEQYEEAGNMSGHDTWKRMKVVIETYVEENANMIFTAIHTHITELFRQSSERITEDIRTEVKELTTLLRLTLIDKVNLSQDHKTLKDAIVETIIATRPAFESRKITLGEHRRALGI
ncbi:hypothetical protein DFH09DRAFT_1382366 [Mycena vulgaris]|nr:hypothetical protein DFH09DRAFT_1382366 [Mycena vulgaris]